jgi:hypothetical protein
VRTVLDGFASPKRRVSVAAAAEQTPDDPRTIGQKYADGLRDEVENGPWRVRMVEGRPLVRWSYGGLTTEWRPVGGATCRCRSAPEPRRGGEVRPGASPYTRCEASSKARHIAA